ncbi:MAG: flavodoxin family protein, partial [Ruminococcus sp.]|nr:flavodoxin family protein [Ruminococcus sp.]
MKTAIVYYSMSGNTEFIAKKIADKISADLIKIEPEKAYPSKGLRKFIWGGKSAFMGDTPKL